MSEASVNERPYHYWSIEQLEDLASTQAENEEILRVLVAELDLRTTRRARRLRRKLDFVVSLDNTGGASQAELSNEEGRASKLTPFSQGAGDDWVSRYRALSAKYETLRATFTLEAELLARWGMTPFLPRDLQDLLFEEWRKRLETSTEGSERTLETLSGDLVRIAREREAAKKFNGKDALKPNNLKKT